MFNVYKTKTNYKNIYKIIQKQALLSFNMNIGTKYTTLLSNEINKIIKNESQRKINIPINQYTNYLNKLTVQNTLTAIKQSLIKNLTNTETNPNKLLNSPANYNGNYSNSANSRDNRTPQMLNNVKDYESRLQDYQNERQNYQNKPQLPQFDMQYKTNNQDVGQMYNIINNQREVFDSQYNIGNKPMDLPQQLKSIETQYNPYSNNQPQQQNISE